MAPSRMVLGILLLIVSALRLGAAPPPSAAAPQSAVLPFEGEWEGEAETDRWPIFMLVRLQRDGGVLGGKLVFLGQTADFAVVKTEGDAFSLLTGSDPGSIVLQGRRNGESLSGTLKQGNASYPFALDRIAGLTKPASRVEAWSQDLDALEQRFLRFDRSFTPAERAAFGEAIAAIRAHLPQLDDAQITMRIASAIALSNNAHTRLYLLRNRTELRRLPLRLWWFSDGLYVVRATRENEKLLGCRVDSIAGLDPRQARDLAAVAFAGNPSWRDYMTVYSLTSPEALHGLGIAPDMEAIPFGFSGCAGASPRVLLRPLPLARSSAPLEAWWDLSPAHAASDESWVQALASSKKALPLYLREPDRFYRYTFLPESGIFYFHYNRDADMKEEDTVTFGTRLLAAFDAAKPKAFVLDLRFNTGGNSDLAAKLMNQLRERTKGMPRFVITGRATFSAGIALAARWRDAGDVTIVGEPIGDDMDFWSEGGNVILPNSGLAAHFGNGAHSYSEAPCPNGVKCLDMNVATLRPDLPTLLSWRDYKEGRDPAMAAIEAQLAMPR